MANYYFNPQLQNAPPGYNDGTQSDYLNTSAKTPNQQSWFGKQNWMGGISGGLASGAANSTPQSQFTIDPFGGYKGALQGFATGGVPGAIIGGVASEIGQFAKVNQNLKNMDTSVNGVTYDAYGRPSYQGGNVASAMDTRSELQKGSSMLGSTKAKLNPLNPLFSTLFGTKRKIRRRINEINSNIASAQKSYNTSEADYRNQQLQMNDYYERVNGNNRLQNVYRSQY